MAISQRNDRSDGEVQGCAAGSDGGQLRQRSRMGLRKNRQRSQFRL